jgi:hypothetical protein
MARTVDPVGRHLALKLGKKPARPGAVKFKFANFLVKPKLPTPPKVFGHEGLIGANWEVRGNDHYGDCVWAGAAHETMLWNKEAARDGHVQQRQCAQRLFSGDRLQSQ